MIGDNLAGQLHSIREASPSVTVEEAVASLRVRRGIVSAEKCPGVRKLATQFERLRIPALQKNYLALHAPGFAVTVSPAYRQDRDLFVDEGEDPLAKWCALGMKTIERCEKPANPQLQRTGGMQAADARR